MPQRAQYKREFIAKAVRRLFVEELTAHVNQVLAILMVAQRENTHVCVSISFTLHF
jgi:hypothetical protein